jgi:hypothetical protein
MNNVQKCCLLFNTANQYSPYYLKRKVTTPRIVIAGSQIDSGESIYKILTPTYQVTLKQKIFYAKGALISGKNF